MGCVCLDVRALARACVFACVRCFALNNYGAVHAMSCLISVDFFRQPVFHLLILSPLNVIQIELSGCQVL